MKTYTRISQLPKDPEVWGDAERAFFWEHEARKRGQQDLKNRQAVGRLLRKSGETITPLAWPFLIALLKQHMPCKRQAA